MRLALALVGTCFLVVGCNEKIGVTAKVLNDTAHVVTIGRCGYESSCGNDTEDDIVFKPGETNEIFVVRDFTQNWRLSDESGEHDVCLTLRYVNLKLDPRINVSAAEPCP